MAEKTIKFEDAKSEELYNWVNEKYTPEKLAENTYFIAECLGVLRGFKKLGLTYNWIDVRINTLNLCGLLMTL